MNLLDSLLRDLRHGGRRLRRDRTFSLIAGATLAVGIGATTALYSVLDTALLRPLPFRDAAELVYVWGTWGPDRQVRGVSYPESEDWRANARSFSEFSIYYEQPLTLAVGDVARKVQGEVVSPGYFEMLGADVLLGRKLEAGDAVPNAAPAVVIGEGLWRSAFGSSADVVGQTVRLEGRPFTVVGVAEPGFLGLSFRAEAWTTLTAVSPEMVTARGARWMAVVARLAPSVTPAAAQSDMERVARNLEATYPELNADRSARVVTLRDEYLSSTRSLILILFGAVVFLLVIAIVNVTNLQLVRGLGRAAELSLRNALGASRARLVQQLLVEGVLVALAAAVVGCVLAFWGLETLIAFLPQGALPPFVTVRMEARAIAFATVVSVGAGTLATLAPALRVTRGQLAKTLVTGARVSVSVAGTGRRVGLQQVLVTAECALAVLVLIGAGLLVRSFRELTRIDPGFEATDAVVARIDLPFIEFDVDARRRIARTIAETLRELPGIQDVQITSDAPLRGNSSAAILQREGFDQDRIRFYRHSVTPGYFAQLGIPLRAGRAFTEFDGPDTDPVAIASQELARRLWPREDPIGRRVRLGGEGGPLVTIVGVVADVRQRVLRVAPDDPGEDPDLYFALAQLPPASFDVVMRGSPTPGQMLTMLRETLARLAPSVALYSAGTLATAIHAQSARERFGSLVLATFAICALVLAAVGIYGIMAFFVGQRRREMAIRLAFGATPGSIGLLVVRHGLTILGVGAIAGTLIAAAATRVLGAFLYNVRPIDPATFAVALLVLAAAGLAALQVPVIRAVRSEPAHALGGD